MGCYRDLSKYESMLISLLKKKNPFADFLSTAARCILLVVQNFASWNPVIKLFAKFSVFELFWEEEM